MSNSRAFTTLEIILVIAVIAISLGFTMLFYQSSQLRADLSTQAAMVISHLRLAQSNAVAGRSEAATGIHLEQNSYTAFLGGVYDAQSPTNVVVTLPTTLQITDIALAGGGTNIIFTAPYGKTQHAGTFKLTSSALNTFTTITVSSLGNIK